MIVPICHYLAYNPVRFLFRNRATQFDKASAKVNGTVLYKVKSNRFDFSFELKGPFRVQRMGTGVKTNISRPIQAGHSVDQPRLDRNEPVLVIIFLLLPFYSFRTTKTQRCSFDSLDVSPLF